MPRLVGKQSNSGLYVGLALLVAILGAVALEYFGVVNYVPNFGRETRLNGSPTNQPARIN